MNWLKSVVEGVVAPVADYAGKRVERKQAQDEIKGQVALAKQAGDHEIKVNVDRWDLASKNSEDGTWKDEYVTVSLVAPINVIVLDSVLLAMGYSDGAATNGVLNALEILNTAVGVPVGNLMATAVAAALSVKVVKGLR